MNSNCIKDKYTFEITASLATKFLGRTVYTNSFKKLNLHSNLLDLLYSIALRHPITIPTSPTITIHNNPILEIFKNSYSTQTLQQIALHNLNYIQLIFYTDGLVIHIITE